MTMQGISFWVAGDPAAQGSKRARIYTSKANPRPRVAMQEMSPKLSPWRERVAAEAARAMDGIPLFDGPLVLRATFYFQRPSTHYGTRKGERYVKPQYAGAHKATTPDLSKMIRAIEDAMSKVVYGDDRQIAEIITSKLWANASPPGVRIGVESCGVAWVVERETA